jgi:MoaA/NifB/PqqE/SkfB family radical SAM enzyme
MDKIVKIYNTVDFLSVYWKLTDYCNFSCSYCPSYLHSGDYAAARKPGYPTDSEITACVATLKDIASTSGKKVIVSIAGGEPTTHTMLEYIVDQLATCCAVTVVTNGSRPVAWWDKLTRLPHAVTISLHPGFTKIDKISVLADYLISKNVGVYFNLSCDPDHWSDVIAMYNSLSVDLKRLVRPKVLQKTNEYNTSLEYTLEYTQEQWNWINTTWQKNEIKFELSDVRLDTRVVFADGHESRLSAVNFYENDLNTHLAWRCAAGSESISISYDGYVTAAICSIKRLGRLDNFTLLPDLLFCTKRRCACPADHMLTKISPRIKNIDIK